MNNKKNYLLSAAVILAAVLLAAPMKAQVTVGELTPPNPDAVLDVRSKGKLGLLLPQVALVSRDKPDPLSKNVPGMIVYNTASAGTDPNNVVPGFYYNDGNQWVQLGSGSGGGEYTGSTSIILNGTSFERAALTGDVTADRNSNATVISDGAVTSAKILDGTITGADIAPKTINVSNIIGSSTAGQVPTSDADGNVTWQNQSGGGGGGSYTAGNGLTLSGTEMQLGGALTKNTTISAAGLDTLKISAPLAITSGGPAVGKVLASDANGNTYWKTLPEIVQSTFIVSPIITDNYTVTNEDYLQLNITSPGHYLVLPDATSPNPPNVGKIIYVSNPGAYDVGLTTTSTKPDTQDQLRNKTYGFIYASYNAMLMYIGGSGAGSWDMISAQ